MLREMAALGFNHVELSHGIRITLVPGILRAVEEGVVKVSSTHNFCPLPIGVNGAAPNLFEPSAPERREREQWLHHTKRSVAFAARVKARALVCHLGRVRFPWFNPERAISCELPRRLSAGAATRTTTSEADYSKRLQRAQAKLRTRMTPFWEQTKASVREVIAYAKEHNVSLAFENREKFDELPLDADFPGFLAEFGPDAPVGYWHDTGHAHLKEAMGVLEHRAQLAGLGARTIGFHLHDVNAAGRDHQPIGEGSIDFAMVKTFWRPEHLLTIELSPRVTIEGVQTSKARVEALLT